MTGGPVQKPGADPAYVHLRLGRSPITECGLTIASPVRWDWDVGDDGWVGELRADEVTCLECLANAALGDGAAS